MPVTNIYARATIRVTAWVPAFGRWRASNSIILVEKKNSSVDQIQVEKKSAGIEYMLLKKQRKLINSNSCNWN
jgi:hypothetical protein